MVNGLTRAEHIQELMATGIEWRCGAYWAGRLEEWLAAVLPEGAYERYEQPAPDDGPSPNESIKEWTNRIRRGIQDWSFPTEDLRTEYLETVSKREENDVLALLRLLIFEESCFDADAELLNRALYDGAGLSSLDDLPPEYKKRLLEWIVGSAHPHPSIRWVLDLLPDLPQKAIDAIAAYCSVYFWMRPEGRTDGLLDAIAIIRARWIDGTVEGREVLRQLSPRKLEVLTAALYRRMGYGVELTPPSRDGGRDVVATRNASGQKEVVQIECKAHSSAVGVEYVRQLQGVVARRNANRGVLVASGRFTRGSYRETAEDNRLELIDGASLTRLLNTYFGPLWIDDHERICRTLHGSA
jgi:restriction system protein